MSLFPISKHNTWL